jgi:hypothetical protein
MRTGHKQSEMQLIAFVEIGTALAMKQGKAEQLPLLNRV